MGYCDSRYVNTPKGIKFVQYHINRKRLYYQPFFEKKGYFFGNIKNTLFFVRFNVKYKRRRVKYVEQD